MWAPRGVSVACLAAVAAFSACSSSSAPPAVSLSPVPSPSVSPGSPVPLPVTLHRGSATVVVTGGLKARFTLPLTSGGAYARAPGSFSASYVDRRGNALIVGGTTPPRRAKTSPALTLSIVVQSKRAHAFPSARGECTITVTRATHSKLSARFRCGKLSRGGKTIRASGTFLASR